MKGRLRVIGACIVLLPGLLSDPGELAAQYDDPPPPAAYAIQDVTVVALDGTRTAGVVLVVRDGRVETLAPGAEIPADAEVLEGDSLFVYPGLVDAVADVDVEFPEAADDGDDVVAWDPPRSASGFMPHREVSRHLAATGEDVAGLRAHGIVAGLVHPDGGMAPGQPAVVLLRADAEAPWELVIGESAGLTMSFQQAAGVYPSQLFGVIAYLRQAFLDAERYVTVRDAYGRSPDGRTAPSWDPDYEALRTAASGAAAVFFEADSDEDIRRVLNLADEIGFQPVIVGGTEAWKLADELAERDVAVLVTTDFPDPDEWDPEADTIDAELEPDAAREKERIVDAWSNAGRLEAAGVTFALTSGGGQGDLLEGARKAVEYGLSREGALRALTSVPADMLGLPALARVVRGGGATFLVADGDLLDEGTGVVYTFVGGVLEEGEAAGGGGGGEAPAADVTGRWEGTVGAQGMNIGLTMTLTMEADGSLSGTMVAEGQGEAPVSGSVSGREVTLVIEAEGMPEPIELTGSLSEDGTTITGGGSTVMGDMQFTVTKSPGSAGAIRSWADLFGGTRTSETGGAR